MKIERHERKTIDSKIIQEQRLLRTEKSVCILGKKSGNQLIKTEGKLNFDKTNFGNLVKLNIIRKTRNISDRALVAT